LEGTQTGKFFGDTDATNTYADMTIWASPNDKTSGTILVDFLFQIDGDDNASGNQPLFESRDSGNADGFTLDVASSSRTFRISCNDTGTNSSSDAYTVGTTYRGRVEYDLANDDATFYLDNTSTDWGTTSLISCNGTTAVTGVEIIRIGAGTGFDALIDQIGVCDDLSGLPAAGEKCGD
jgi:hypothetical protein